MIKFIGKENYVIVMAHKIAKNRMVILPIRRQQQKPNAVNHVAVKDLVNKRLGDAVVSIDENRP